MSFNSDGNATSSTSDAAPKFKSFVSEGEIEEKRKKRQEEWEKVRKPEEPLEAPEETYDGRSLFDRLQEQKDRKQTEYEESHKLKNLIRGLDDDEVSFLELVDKTKIEMESRILKEELHELNEYRKAVATLSEESAAARLQEMKKNIMGDQHKKTKQQDPLLKAVKRKSSTGESSSTSADKQRKVSESGIPESNKKEVLVKKETEKASNGEICQERRVTQGSLQCIGVLPGLGVYSDSSDSENSSGSESPDCDPSFDLVGRRRIIHAHGSTNS